MSCSITDNFNRTDAILRVIAEAMLEGIPEDEISDVHTLLEWCRSSYNTIRMLDSLDKMWLMDDEREQLECAIEDCNELLYQITEYQTDEE